MEIDIKIATTNKDKERCFSIRREVFVKEQNISEKIEFDDTNLNATYFIATLQNKSIGTARYRFTDQGVKLERFAVLKSFRNLGVGKTLVDYIINIVRDKKFIYLHAQESVVEFYFKLGFKKIGSPFFEAEIPHQKMKYDQKFK